MDRREKIIEILDNLGVYPPDQKIGADLILNLFEEKEVKDDVYVLAKFIHDNIRPSRQKNGKIYINDQARNKIKARLKQYTLQELLTSLKKFTHNSWRMKNNRNKSLDWFFRTDAQIETFLNLEEDMIQSEEGYRVGDTLYTLTELQEAEAKGEIYYDSSRGTFIANTKQEKTI